MPSHEQVRECRQHVDLAAVLEHATKAGLLKAKLPLDHAERMIDFCMDVSLGGLDQVIQVTFRSVGESTPLPRPHRHTEADGLALFTLCSGQSGFGAYTTHRDVASRSGWRRERCAR